MTEPLSENTADVIVVGAGPAGSATAYHLAKSGLDVLLLEKTEFPREKVCGDGLTPRATKQLVAMGIDISEEAGWLRNKGLRIIGGGVRLQLDWPELASFPDYGLVRKRDDFDEQLAHNAQKAGCPSLRALQRRRPDRRRAHRPDHRRERQARRGETRSHLPRAPGGRRRRQLHPPLPRDGPAPPRGPPDGRGRADLLHLAPPRGRLPGVLAGTVGPPRRRGPPAARLRLDLRHGRRHLERRPRCPQHLRLLQGAGLAGGPEGVVRVHARGLGLHPRKHDRPDPRRRPPDGLQPPTPLHEGVVVGRRQPAAW